MNNNYMQYDRAKLTRCADMVKVYIANSKKYHKKAEYATLSFQLKECYEFAERELNSVLFEYNGYIKTFVNVAFRYKDYKASEIQTAEKDAVRYICNELNAILKLINHNPEYEKCAEY